MSQVICPKCNAAVEVPDPPTTQVVECPVCFAAVPTGLAPPPPPEPSAETLSGPPAFTIRPFQATTGGSPPGLIVTAAAGLAAAVVLAVVFGIIGSFFWLVLIFPIIHGLTVGATTGLGARLAKYRLPAAVGTVGAVAGLLSAAGLHVLEYVAFRLDPAAPEVGFWKFMDLRADEGIRIGKAGQGGNGMNLGYVGSIIYWVVEMVAATIASAGVAAAMSTGPFCGACNVWKRKRTFGPYRIYPGPAIEALAAGAPTAIVHPSNAKDQVMVGVYECPHCRDAAEIDVKATGTHQEGNKTWNYELFVTYPGEAAAVFEAVDDLCREQGVTGRKKKK
jgi:hypothetical protein